MADLNYIESGYFDPELGYYVYTADAESAIESVSIISCDISVIAGGVAVFGYGAIESFASIDCTISHIEGCDMFAFSEAAIAIQGEVIRGLNISATSVFSIATDGRRFRDIAAAESALFSVDVVNSRSRAFTIETQAAFSLSATYKNIRPFAAALTSISTLSITVSHIEGANIVANNFATLSITPQYAKLASGNITSTASLSATVETRIGIVANLVTTATVYARPQAGVTWVDATGLTTPQSASVGLSGAVVDTTNYKFGGGSLYIPGNSSSGYRRGILATLNANDLSIPAQTTNFSFSFWFKADQNPTAGVSYPFFQAGYSYSDAAATNRTYYKTSIDRTDIKFRYKVGANTGRDYRASLSGITLTNWNFFEIAGVWNGSVRDLKFYVNGILKTTTDGLIPSGSYAYLDSPVPVTSDDLVRPSIYGFNTTYGYFLDDFQYRTGSGAVIGTSAPTAQAIPNSYTKTLLTFNSDFSDVVGAITISGAADLYANTLLTANVDAIKLVETSTAFTSAFTQSVTGEALRGLVSSVSSSAALTGQVNVVTDTSLSANINATQSTVGSITRTTSSSISSDFAQTVIGNVSKEFASSVASEFAQTVIPVKSVDAIISAESIATELTAVAKIGDFLVTCESVATLSIDPVIIASGSSNIALEVIADVVGNYVIDNNVILADNFIVAAEVQRNRYVSAALVTQATVEAIPILVSVNAIDVDSYFTLNGSAMRLRGVSSTQSMSAIVNAEIQITKEFYCDLAADTAFNASVNATLAADVALISNASLNVIISHIEGADIVVDSFATMTIDADAGKFGVADLTSAFTQTTLNRRVRFAGLTVNAVSSVNAQINEIVPLQAVLSSVTSQTAQAKRTASATVAIASSAGLTCIISHIEGADIVAGSFAAVTANVRNLKGLRSAVTTIAIMTATINEIVQLASVLQSTSTVDVTATIAQNGQAAIVSEVTLEITATTVKQGSAAFNSAMTFVANVMEIDIDSINQTVYIIPADNRTWKISKEIWSRNIAEETREYII